MPDKPNDPVPDTTHMRIEIDADGQMDELFVRDATVHIERMSDHGVWMRVNDQVVWITSRGKLSVTTEDES